VRRGDFCAGAVAADADADLAWTCERRIAMAMAMADFDASVHRAFRFALHIARA
jgi:hypothetical protein